jgi:hypothetical protein
LPNFDWRFSIARDKTECRMTLFRFVIRHCNRSAVKSSVCVNHLLSEPASFNPSDVLVLRDKLFSRQYSDRGLFQ